MSLTPMSRIMLHNLKVQTDEENRIKNIKEFVGQIYENTLLIAKNTSNMIYYHPIPVLVNKDTNETSYDPFYRRNMSDILNQLQQLFPDCSVTHTLLSLGTNGNLYDISKMNDKMLPYIDTPLENSYIVIDWT